MKKKQVICHFERTQTLKYCNDPEFSDRIVQTWVSLIRNYSVCHATCTESLKELATELGPVFAHLFQQSIDTGEIPKEWSLANVCPLFKKSDRSLACNYRPVSLTCVPCKLLEHIVCSNIMAHLDGCGLLSDRQHAFRKGHSCETQLTTVINDWAKILDNRGQVDTFILDFEKAFDTPPHELLKSKLFSYGIGGKTLKWIDSFLCFSSLL